MKKSSPYSIRNNLHVSLILGLSILFCFTLLSCGVFDSNKPFSGGNGTIDNPFQISSLEQLQKIAEDDNLDKHYIQVADIDASASEELQNGSGFKFIGDAEQPFTGSYDGNGYSIRNLKINFNKFDQFNGMFGYVKEGVLENITIDNRGRLNKLDTNSFASKKQNSQSLDETSELQNIDIADMDGVGGLAGMNDSGLIRNCHFIGSITPPTGGAGLVGINTGTIESSSFEGKVSGGIYTASGLVTYNSGSIRHSFVKGEIGGQAAFGFVGNNDGVIEISYVNMQVTGYLGVAGFVNNNRGVIRSSFMRGTIIGGRFSGGFVADNYGQIENVYVLADLEMMIEDNGNFPPSYEIGGVVGRNDSGGVIQNAFIAGTMNIGGDVEFISSFGGYAGVNSGMIEHGYWDKEATGMDTGIDQGTPEGATSLTTNEMTGPAAEQNMPDFDWVNIWRTTENGYPVLRWEEKN